MLQSQSQNGHHSQEHHIDMGFKWASMLVIFVEMRIHVCIRRLTFQSRETTTIAIPWSGGTIEFPCCHSASVAPWMRKFFHQNLFLLQDNWYRVAFLLYHFAAKGHSRACHYDTSTDKPATHEGHVTWDRLTSVQLLTGTIICFELQQANLNIWYIQGCANRPHKCNPASKQLRFWILLSQSCCDYGIESGLWMICRSI